MNWEPAPNADQFEGCIGCVHYRAGRCAAYPERIPLAILSGEVDHMVPRPGQVGTIVFEPVDLEIWRRTRQRLPRVAAKTAGERARAG